MPTQSDGVTPQSWAVGYLNGLGCPTSTENVKIIVAWIQAECPWNGSPPDGAVYTHNPLNTTEPGFGGVSLPGSSVGVKKYPTWGDGLSANLKVTKANFQDIISMLKSGNASPQTAASTIDNSRWGTTGLTASMISAASAAPGGTPVTPSGTTGTTKSNAVPASPWTVGDASNPDQDYWTTISQYAMDGQLYAFSDGEYLIIADGIELMSQRPVAVLNRLDPTVLWPSEATWDNCLMLDTSIPIPGGWTTMGDLKVGDLVFGSDGRPVRVLRTSSVHAGRPCYRVSFSDKTSIVSDESHYWRTVSGRTGHGVRTTGQIRDSMDDVHRIEIPAQAHSYVTITAVEPVPSVPVRCIAVDAEDHLFLAGEGMVPTHNTAFMYASTHVKRGKTQRKASLAKLTSPTEVTLRQICDIDKYRAGDVIYLKNWGPADGPWLIGDCTRSVFQPYSDLTLVQAMSPIDAASGVAGGTGTNTQSGTPVTAGGYTNPFAKVTGLLPSRIDMGVDYSGGSTIVAVGAGKVTSISNGGWPGGAFIEWQLSNGAYAGKHVYFAEHIHPSVHVGQVLNTGDPIGTMYPPSIEAGWSIGDGGTTLAAHLGQYPFDGAVTAAGVSFNHLMTKLGVPSGKTNGQPVHGTMPPGYP